MFRDGESELFCPVDSANVALILQLARNKNILVGKFFTGEILSLQFLFSSLYLCSELKLLVVE